MAMCPSVLIDSRNHGGMTPLMKAALQGRIRCTRLLLLAGASPILRDFRRSMCALDWARYTGRTKCIEIIEKVTIPSSQISENIRNISQFVHTLVH